MRSFVPVWEIDEQSRVCIIQAFGVTRMHCSLQAYSYVIMHSSFTACHWYYMHILPEAIVRRSNGWCWGTRFVNCNIEVHLLEQVLTNHWYQYIYGITTCTWISCWFILWFKRLHMLVASDDVLLIKERQNPWSGCKLSHNTKTYIEILSEWNKRSEQWNASLSWPENLALNRNKMSAEVWAQPQA